MQVKLKQTAIKDLKKIDKSCQNRIIKFLDNITEEDIKNCIKLQGLTKDLYRIRLNDYRLIFDQDKTNITILRILHRKSAYNQINKL